MQLTLCLLKSLPLGEIRLVGTSQQACPIGTRCSRCCCSSSGRSCVDRRISAGCSGDGGRNCRRFRLRVGGCEMLVVTLLGEQQRVVLQRGEGRRRRRRGRWRWRGRRRRLRSRRLCRGRRGRRLRRRHGLRGSSCGEQPRVMMVVLGRRKRSIHNQDHVLRAGGLQRRPRVISHIEKQRNGTRHSLGSQNIHETFSSSAGVLASQDSLRLCLCQVCFPHRLSQSQRAWLRLTEERRLVVAWQPSAQTPPTCHALSAACVASLTAGAALIETLAQTICSGD